MKNISQAVIVYVSDILSINYVLLYNLVKETFPDLEFLGYYTTGDHTETDPQDVAIQKQAMKFNESPFLLKFNAENPIISEKVLSKIS